MDRVHYISKSFYNTGKSEVEHLLPNEQALSRLTVSKDRLKRVILTLKDYDCEFPQVEYHSGFCDLWDSESLVSADTNFSTFQSATDRIDRRCWCTVFDEKVTSNLLYISADLNRHLSWTGPIKVSEHIRGGRRAAEIHEKLRTLRQELRMKFGKEVLMQIKQAAQELQLLLSHFHSLHRSDVRYCRKAVAPPLISDIRRKFRRKFAFIFKTLPDFSGCEEEARFKSFNQLKPLFLPSIRKNVQQTIFIGRAGSCYWLRFQSLK